MKSLSVCAYLGNKHRETMKGQKRGDMPLYTHLTMSLTQHKKAGEKEPAKQSYKKF